MWKELIQKLTSECEFMGPTAVDRLDTAEAKLRVKFPDDLRSLLGESDGVEGEYGLGLVWPLDRIIEDNINFRRSEIFLRSTCLSITYCFLVMQETATSLPSQSMQIF